MKNKVFFLNADNGLKINIDVDPNLPTTLYGDRIRILQLMDTLNANAIKYTRQGEVDIKIVWTGSGITFSVEDTGIGMKPQDLKRIGEIFYKANKVRQLKRLIILKRKIKQIMLTIKS